MTHSRIRSSIAKHPRAWYYTLLACAVTVVFIGADAWMLTHGKGLVWWRDARPLYTNFLIWSYQAFQDAIAAFADGRGFSLPQYTYSMGYGADVPMSMGSYLQDPLNLIVYALPIEWIDLSYALMTWARMLLAAMAFSWYCLSRGHRRRVVGVAALAYVTCGFVLFLGAFRHPKFMDWAILLPLILLGADRLFERKRPTLFIVAFTLQFCISIYYSYMSCIVLLIYCLCKYFLVQRKRSVGNFAGLVAKFVLCGSLALLISGLFSMPQITALLSQERATSGGTIVPLVFTLKYYAKIVAHFIGASASTEGLILGCMTTIGLIGFLVGGKHLTRNERLPWLVGLVLCIAGVLIPYLGHVMNGMGYSTDRWMLVLAFVCCYILCTTIPKLPAFDRADWRRAKIGVACFAAITAIYAVAQVFLEDGLMAMVWPMLMTVLFVGTFAGLRKLSSSERPSRIYAFSAASVIVCAIVSGICYCSPLGTNWGTTFSQAGATWKSLEENTPGAAAELIDDDSIWRYSIPRMYESKNSALIHGVMGIDFYTSYYNQSIDDFRQELGISDHHMNFSFLGSDSRLAVEAVTGAKYYICKEKDKWRTPHGYVDTGLQYKDYLVFENTNPIPLAFVAPGVVPTADYANLSMVQKQEALLQGAVIDPARLTADVPEAKVEFSSKECDYTLTDSNGVELGENSAHVVKSGGSVTIRFEGLAESETYLSISNLGYDEFPPSELAMIRKGKIGLKDRISDLLWTRNTTYPITAKIGKRSKNIDPATPTHIRYGGKVDWIFNLGFSKKPAKEMTIVFDEPGDYSFDSMKVVCQPVKPVEENARKLAGAAVDNLELNVNSMKGQVTLSDSNPSVAVFMFAYTPGWSVTVDGRPATALKANSGFLGVEVSGAGMHDIEWTYETPGVRTGIIMTCIGLAIAIVLIIVAACRSRRKYGKHAKR